MSAIKELHCKATRETIRTSREHERWVRLRENTPDHQLLEKTASLWSAFMRLGCGGPWSDITFYSVEEKAERDKWQSQVQAARRGHITRDTCDGRLVLEISRAGKHFVR
jgi:hypothetical protein